MFLSQNTRKITLLSLENKELSELMMSDDDVTDEEYNQFDDVPFFVDTKSINLLETRISYSTMLPYSRTDANGKLVQG
jgi:methylaspartate ammonia-lyase